MTRTRDDDPMHPRLGEESQSHGVLRRPLPIILIVHIYHDTVWTTALLLYTLNLQTQNFHIQETKHPVTSFPTSNLFFIAFNFPYIYWEELLEDSPRLRPAILP